MNNDSNSWIGWVITIAIIYGIYSLFSSGDSVKSEYIPSTNSYSSYKNSDYGSYGNYSNEDSIIEPENPYDEGSGHSAGYEWAQENDVSSCGGNSNSFIEGCEEYLSQQEEYEN